MQRKGTEDDKYYDTHCWTFTPSSFYSILLDSIFLKLVEFDVEEITENNGNEFYVHLRREESKTFEDSEFYAKRESLLRSAIDEVAYNSPYAYSLRAQLENCQAGVGSIAGREQKHKKLACLEDWLASVAAFDEERTKGKTSRKSLVALNVVWRHGQTTFQLTTPPRRSIAPRNTSAGSNFLVGGSGDDTFFVDDRSPSADIWSTVSNFHAGDSATIFGITQSGFNTSFVDGQGATGFTGLTLHVTVAGHPTASLTLAGFSTADLSSGRISTSFGTEADGTPYLFVHANS